MCSRALVLHTTNTLIQLELIQNKLFEIHLHNVQGTIDLFSHTRHGMRIKRSSKGKQKRNRKNQSGQNKIIMKEEKYMIRNNSQYANVCVEFSIKFVNVQVLRRIFLFPTFLVVFLLIFVQTLSLLHPLGSLNADFH